MSNKDISTYGLKVADSYLGAVHTASRYTRDSQLEGKPRSEIDLKKKAHLQEISLAHGRVLHQIFSILTDDPFMRPFKNGHLLSKKRLVNQSLVF